MALGAFPLFGHCELHGCGYLHAGSCELHGCEYLHTGSCDSHSYGYLHTGSCELHDCGYLQTGSCESHGRGYLIQALVSHMAVDICTQAFVWTYVSFLLSAYPSLPAHMAALCLTVG